MIEKEMTPSGAEAIGDLAAELLVVLDKACRDNPEIDWMRAVSAAALACRGMAAKEMAVDPKLDLDAARNIMLGQFLNVLAMPEGLVRILPNTDGGDELETVVLPVNRH